MLRVVKYFIFLILLSLDTKADVASASDSCKSIAVRIAIVDSKYAENLNLELTNTSEKTVFFAKWFAGQFDGVSPQDIFKVLDAHGKEVSYFGIMAKRGEPIDSDIISIPPKASVKTTIDLTEHYLRKSGLYTVKYSSWVRYGFEKNENKSCFDKIESNEVKIAFKR